MTDPDASRFGKRCFGVWRLANMAWSSAPAPLFSTRATLRYRAEHPDGCRFYGARPDGNQQAIQFGHKERGARTRSRRDACNSTIHRAFWLENIEETSPATHVNTP